jgi:nitrate/TMAO reductase-like tetraheme cytochrome c subunit
MKRTFLLAAALLALLVLFVVITVVVARRNREDVATTLAPPRLEISGMVESAGRPIAGARVRARGTDVNALSDALGLFRLSLDALQDHRITASKGGYFIDGADARARVSLNLKPLPHEDNSSYSWVDPRPDSRAAGNCANCHAEIYREWSSGGHARSATGRYFRDLYGSHPDHGTASSWTLLAENANGAGVCASCHAPTADFDETLDLRQIKGVAAQGVHCDYCHKVTDAGLGTLGLTHGRHGMQLLRPADGQLFLGPLDDVDRGEDAYLSLYQQSKYCASCHEGTVFGVHVYSTFSEWLSSPAAAKGQQCQSCHMKPTGTLANFAPGNGGIDRQPETLANHLFFAESKEAMLRRCLDLQVEVAPAFGNVDVVTRLKAVAVGHRVPTGFIDRQLILVVEGFDADGSAIHSSSGPLLGSAAGEQLTEKPGWLYARMLHTPGSSTPLPFWTPDHVLSDTRLTPEVSDVLNWVFPADVKTIKVALIYRPFWQETANVKEWGDLDTVLKQNTIRVPSERPRPK